MCVTEREGNKSEGKGGETHLAHQLTHTYTHTCKAEHTVGFLTLGHSFFNLYHLNLTFPRNLSKSIPEATERERERDRKSVV